MEFPAMLQLFDAHMLGIGLADRTRHNYRREIMAFWCHWCALRSVEILDAPRSELTLYLASLSVEGSGRGMATRALKAFYSFTEGEFRQDNPAAALRLIRPKARPAPSLTQDDARALVRAAFRRDARRGWAILLALHTGARVGSLAALRRDDVDLQGLRIFFAHAKGGRTYEVPLNQTAAHAALRLIELGSDPILGVGAARFRQWVHQAERDADLGRIWPHLLRHEFSNRVAANGDPEAWRRLMGHADLSQWTRYVHAEESRLRAALPGR